LIQIENKLQLITLGMIRAFISSTR